MQRAIAIFLFSLLMGPLTGSLTNQQDSNLSDWVAVDEQQIQWMPKSSTLQIPQQISPQWIDNETSWWERTVLDQDRNEIHDSLESMIGVTGIALVYETDVTAIHLNALEELGLTVVDVIEAVDGVLLGKSILLLPRLLLHLMALSWLNNMAK
tara:strand:- start:437 stop:895 length:459 start_codon:yes stop_codon:yes gene_type:complete